MNFYHLRHGGGCLPTLEVMLGMVALFALKMEDYIPVEPQ